MNSVNKEDALLDNNEPNKVFIKYKHLIALLVAGYVLDFVGAWAKILHLSFSNSLFTIAVVVKMLAGVIFILKILNDKRANSFLNR